MRDAGHLAVPRRGLDVDHARAAAPLQSVFVRRSALAVTVFGDGKNQRTFDWNGCVGGGGFRHARFGFGLFQFGFGFLRIFRRRRHADNIIAFVEIHAAHTVGRAAHRAHIGFVEADGLAIVGGEEDDLGAIGQRGAHQFIALINADSDNAARHHVGKLGLLHRAVARGEENESALFFQIAHSEHGAHRLAGLQRYQVAHVLALAGGAHVRDFINLQPEHASGVGENENVGVGRGDEKMLDKILVARLHAGAALASAALLAISGDWGALQVAAMADGDRDLFVGDQVFQLDLGGFVFNDGAAFITVELPDFFQFGDDHLAQLLFRAKNGFELGDVLAHLFQFVRDFVN